MNHDRQSGNKMNRDCAICGCSQKVQLYKQHFNNTDISLMENYDVVCCKDCGFVYADNIPSQAEFNNYYEVMSKYEFDYQDGIVSGTYIDHFTKIIKFITPYLNANNARILDVGCSTGALLSIFKSQGYFNLLGIDPAPSCVKFANELYNIEASVNNIYNFNTNEKFDLIILSAILEHVVDLTSSMQKIWSLLKDQGLLFIEIPDAERFDSYIFTPFQQFSFEHINYFSQYSIKNLLTKNSFEIIKMQKDENRINQTIDPDIFILARKSNKTNFKIIKENICELKIRNYISRCSEMDLKIKKVIEEKLLHRNKIIVWGVGTHTQRLIGSGLDLSKILFFVDSNKRYRGKKINGVEIRLPEDIKEGIPILISTYSYQDEVFHQIREALKLKNEIIKIY